ncbi:helix-turn-helix transcriptional regulator [Bradyrhizobium sp. HKCCYLS2033]|uniref:helix-turn-helix transcriptional regulator n=1 Tax=Bradyrhizobium sp. HKCCYLS2033 TaxID=3420739 RepID=UPI003EBFE842
MSAQNNCTGMKMTELLKDYIPREALARELGRAEKTLIRWELDGKGPPVTRLGRKVLYFRPSIEKWLRSREQTAA